jgi:UTRA domain
MIAERLAIEPGDPRHGHRLPLLRQRRTHPALGTPVERPEDGDVLGVTARMDSIGQHVTEVTERVTTRAPRPHETEALAIPPGVPVLVTVRTFYADTTPLETADILVPGDRYKSLGALLWTDRVHTR